VCKSGCDFASLQDAADAATPDHGTIIEVQDGTHTEAGITISKDVIIRGLGAQQTTVQAHATVGEATDRVFLVEEGASAVLQHLTIRHGAAPKGEHGGGILNHGTLTVLACVVTHNSASGGAGINSDGTLNVISSTICHNTADDAGPPGHECGSGGGLLSTSGTLTVVNSTIHDNQAGLRSSGTAGGVRVGCKATGVLVNSTISGNQSVNYGAGLVAIGPVRVINCTICDNRTPREAGVYIRGRLDMQNTLIANNHSGTTECYISGSGGYQGRGQIGLNENNWVSDGSCGAAFSGDPRLGPLADNGGPTWTHALLPTSPAIDAVPASAYHLPIDQRGLPRPAQADADTAWCDIGAYERQP
jgi:hypothetical protein